jgi:hypothetical protein
MNIRLSFTQLSYKYIELHPSERKKKRKKNVEIKVEVMFDVFLTFLMIMKV